jgi:hypothetical protein
MAEVMQLKDGKVQTVFDSKDFKWLVEQYMGFDASRYFENLIDEFEQAVHKAQDKEQSDLGSYEASLESNTRAFQDIEEICRNMIADFNKEEGRNRLAALRPWRNQVQEIIKIINNQI